MRVAGISDYRAASAAVAVNFATIFGFVGLESNLDTDCRDPLLVLDPSAARQSTVVKTVKPTTSHPVAVTSHGHPTLYHSHSGVAENLTAPPIGATNVLGAGKSW